MLSTSYAIRKGVYMLFVMFRIIFWSLVFCGCFLLIRKSHIIHKCKWSLIALLGAVVLTTVSALLPIENIFVTFSSPQSAYNYNHSGDVKLIVDGEKTNFVVGVKGDVNIYAIIPKSDNGWKLGMSFDTKRVIQKISDGVTIYMYQYKNTDDYYITVLDTNGGLSKISDNLGSEFQYLDKSNSTLNKTFYTYYAYINNFNDQYTLTVNDKTIKVQN